MARALVFKEVCGEICQSRGLSLVSVSGCEKRCIFGVAVEPRSELQSLISVTRSSQVWRGAVDLQGSRFGEV